MYKYTQEQLDSMKKVEATREQRLKNLFARMSADEKYPSYSASCRKSRRFCADFLPGEQTAAKSRHQGNHSRHPYT